MNRKQFVPFENVVQPDNSLLLAVFPDPESHPDFLEQLDSCWETLHRAKFALIPKLLPFFCRDGDTGGFDNIENMKRLVAITNSREIFRQRNLPVDWVTFISFHGNTKVQFLAFYKRVMITLTERYSNLFIALQQEHGLPPTVVDLEAALHARGLDGMGILDQYQPDYAIQNLVNNSIRIFETIVNILVGALYFLTVVVTCFPVTVTVACFALTRRHQVRFPVNDEQ
eukprot:scaffold3169_cov118-Amphora_coffeaeformis.AAC.1